MNKIALLLICFTLTACGGGSGAGSDGAPGKSAYQIWLDAGNTGTEQDFLDSLVANVPNNLNSPSEYVVNMQQSLDKTGCDYTVTTMDWPSQSGYKRYQYSINADTHPDSAMATGNNSAKAYTYVYTEKELNLANYGIYLLHEDRKIDEFGIWEYPTTSTINAYIHNLEGIGANVYTPTENTVFRGGTLAYLYKNSSSYSHTVTNPEMLKGDAEYTYTATNPHLKLFFDNYYTLTIDKYGKVIADGTNNTGRSEFDLITAEGDYVNYGYTYDAEYRNFYSSMNSKNGGYSNTEINNVGFVAKNDTEEAVGTYEINFEKYQYTTEWYTNTTGYTYPKQGDAVYYNKDIRMIGAFGGTKQ